MNLKKLAYFVTLVDIGNFTLATEKLFITQPALSWNIKDFEESLNTTLIKRTPDGIELTETGDILYHGAKTLLYNANQLKRSISIVQNRSKRKVRLGMTILSSIEYMNIFQYFNTHYHEYQLEFIQRGSKEIQELVADGKLDIGLVSDPIYYPNLKASRKTLEDYYYDAAVVVASDNPLAKHSSLTLEMIQDESISMMTEGFAMGNEVAKRMYSLGMHPNIVFTNENWEVLVEHVSSYKSITFLPMGIKDLLTRDDLVWIPSVDDRISRFNLSLVTSLDLNHKYDRILYDRFYNVLMDTNNSMT